MKRTALFQIVAIAVATFSLSVSQTVSAATPQAQNQPVMGDIVLRQDNMLVGQLVDTTGTPQSGEEVSLYYQGKNIATAKTDANGVFAVRGIRGGVYRVASNKSQGVYRVWTPQTAPPAAKQGAILVEGQRSVNGQFGGGGWTPVLVAGGAIAAVTIPTLITRSKSSPSSP